MNEVQKIKFKVEKIVYHDKEKMWGVLATKPADSLGKIAQELANSSGNISITGNFDGVFEGCEIEVTGDIVNNPRFGKQIQIRCIKIIEDIKSKEGIINFLAKSVIKGISTQNAKKIYKEFGSHAISVVLDDTDKILEISGIGIKTVNKVKESVAAYKAMKPLVTFCTELGLQYTLIKRLHEEFGADAVSIIKEDPFRILEMSESFTFRQADEIFIKNGGDPLNKKRLKTGFLYALKNSATLEGSTGYSSTALKSRFFSLLELSNSAEYYESIKECLLKEDKIDIGIRESIGEVVFYKEYLRIEKSIAEKIAYLNTYGIPSDKIRENIVTEEINNFPFTLNKQQVSAIRTCLNKPVCVLTAPAGCGKTTITKALFNIYRKCGLEVELVCPTAKAALRLSECTGGQAQTIHRFLGFTPDEDFNSRLTGKNLDNMVVIVDEASMLDIMLFNRLLSGATMTTKIILVGDNNQLPSVQAGNVLGDLISSYKVPVAILTDIMRQSKDSHIIKYCNMINNGELFDPCEESDFHYEEFGTADELKEVLISHYKEDTKKYGLGEVQVITPYKKGELGMDSLNVLLQLAYNANGEEITEPYRLGDRVRHTVNDYKKNVFNGETGIIKGFDEEDGVILVNYPDKVIQYENSDLYELTLSYCSTVHASQGSEYKVCYVILDDTAVNDYLFIRRLLYTAVSRGKQKVYILAKPYLLDKCITNASYRPRLTKLKDFLDTANGSPYL